jgi:cellulose synthase/poly-beta-1,6-N-acetylglucosamine synthase-like glycosyltransferase
MRTTDLPRISVVTSCFNAGQYVEATLRSVIQQDYPNLEYIFIDGASTDCTLAIARRYEAGLAMLRSERDEGQYHGIQKGLNLATGEVMAWLNGDDIYCPWTLSLVGHIFANFPEVDWIVGSPSYMNAQGVCTRISGVTASAYPREYISNGWYRPALAGYLQQESMFWRKSLWDRVGGLNLSLSYAADFDLWRRFSSYAELVAVAVPLALFRHRPGEQRSSKGAQHYEAEVTRICDTLPPPPVIWRTLSSRGESLRHLCRMARWKRTPAIAYSNQQQRWVMTTNYRPVARTSLVDVLMESALRQGRF